MRRKKITRTQRIYSFKATNKIVNDCLSNGAKIENVKAFGIAYGLSVIFAKDYTMVIKEKDIALNHTIRKYSVCPKKYLGYCC